MKQITLTAIIALYNNELTLKIPQEVAFQAINETQKDLYRTEASETIV